MDDLGKGEVDDLGTTFGHYKITIPYIAVHEDLCLHYKSEVLPTGESMPSLTGTF